MTDASPSRSQMANVLTLAAFLVALACFLTRVFWWTHHQFLDCAVQIAGRPQPAYCSAVSELEWFIWYAPLVSLLMCLIVLRRRRHSWHSRPLGPVIVFWFSVLMLTRTAFVLFVGFFLRDMH
jgi:hypothetical protein